MDNKLTECMQCRVDNTHCVNQTLYTDSALYGYTIMPVVYILYGYHESELNHMFRTDLVLNLRVYTIRDPGAVSYLELIRYYTCNQSVLL